MNRFSRLAGLALIGLAGIATAARADEPSTSEASHGGFRKHRARQFERCLSTAGLNADQQASIDSIRSEARALIEADLAALKAARERLQADLASGADKSVLGQDLLDQDAAAEKLRNDHKATRDQIVAQLDPNQQSALESCMKQRRGKGEAPPETSQ